MLDDAGGGLQHLPEALRQLDAHALVDGEHAGAAARVIRVGVVAQRADLVGGLAVELSQIKLSPTKSRRLSQINFRQPANRRSQALVSLYPEE